VPLAVDLHTEEELEVYFLAVAEGKGLDVAAEKIGTTATRMRRLRKHDPDFNARLTAAEREWKEGGYPEMLKMLARRRAVEGSDRILEVELATWVSEYHHLRRDRMKVDGRVEHAILLPPGALEALDTMTREQLVAFREVLLALGADVIDGEITALPEGT
jgi:hypothetical protein